MHIVLSEISQRILIRIFKLTLSSVSWLHSFSFGVSGFVALGLFPYMLLVFLCVSVYI